MRKSLFVCLMMFAAFSAEKVSAYYGNQVWDLFGIQRASVDFNVGYRNDEFEWRFRDPRLSSFVSTVVDDVRPITGNLPEEIQSIVGLLENSRIACLIDNALGFTSPYKSQWKHLNMVNVGLEGRLETCCGIYARVDGNYGWIAHGRYQPKGTFTGSTAFFDQTLSKQGLAPNPRKNAQGHSWDVDVGLGYNFKFCCDTFQVAPMIGWSYYNLNLRTYKDRSLIDFSGEIDLEDVPPIEESIDLGRFYWAGKSKSSYHANWTGPWVGFDADYHYDCNWSLFMTFEYHYSRHCGKGHTRSFNNLIVSDTVFDDLDPLDILLLDDVFDATLYSKNKFRNRVSIQGYKVGGGINYTLNDCFYAGFKIDYYHMRKVRNDSSKVKSIGSFELVINNAGDEEVFIPIDLGSDDRFCLSGIRWKSLRYEVQFGANF